MLKLISIFVVLQVIGIHSFNIQPRILDGLINDPEDFPFFIAISRRVGDRFLLGSATIISDRGNCGFN